MATTGTGTGSDFSGLNDLLKNVYTDSFENNVEADSEVSDIFEQAEGFKVVEGPDGKAIVIAHQFSSGGGVGSVLEDDYLPTATTPTIKQSTLTIKQQVAMVELSGRTLRRVKEGPAAFATWANEALPMKARRLAFHIDRMRIGLGDGVICRIDEGSPATTDLGIDAAYGIAGLEGATNLLLRDDNLRFCTSSAGSSARTGTAKVVGVDYDNSEIDIDALPTSTADNDFVFLGDTNVRSIGEREMMGLEGIIDNGALLASIQGLSRTTYPELKAQQIDASSATYGGTLNENLLDIAATRVYERAMGKTTHILVNRSGQRSFWNSLKGDRTFIDPKGNFQGGKAQLTMLLGNGPVVIRAARKVPASRCYGIDASSIKRYTIGSGRWDDTDGSVWNRTVDGTGRKDAFFAVYVREENLGTVDPGKNFKITGLSAT